MSKLSAIDLFAGAGGLSYGFKQTGMISFKAAVEINKHAQDTFKENHKGVSLFSDITKINYGNILAKHGDIDLVIGGPPCQGFSNANRQKSDLISGNNQLVREFVKCIQNVNPKAFVMENVKSMASHTHKFFVSHRDVEELDRLGIKRGVEKFSIGRYTPICRELIELISQRMDLRTYVLAPALFSKLCAMYRASKSPKGVSVYLRENEKYFKKMLGKWGASHRSYWSPAYRNLWMEIGQLLTDWYDNGRLELDYLVNAVFTVTESQRVVRKINETREHGVELINVACPNDDVVITVETYNVFEYVIKKLKSFGYKVNYGVLNAVQFGVPQTRERLFVIGIREDQLRAPSVEMPQGILTDPSIQFTIGDAIRDLESYPVSTEANASPIYRNEFKSANKLQRLLCDSKVVFNHVATASSKVALERFSLLKPGQNFHDLSEEHKSTYSNAQRTQNTIYQRLDYTKSSKAVCNVRKSMWIHPSLNRAISIREAARLQSFPDSFKFAGPKNSMYQQIANAVPPLLAQAVAEQVLCLLGYSVPKSLRQSLIEDSALNAMQTNKDMEVFVGVS